MAVVGPQRYSNGAQPPVTLDKVGNIITNHAVGEYAEMAIQGRIYSACMQAGAALGTGLTATAVTVTLYNPSGSSVYLSLLQTCIAITSVQTTTATTSVFGYAVNVNPEAAIITGNTKLTVRPGLLGAQVGQGVALSATTLPATPVFTRIHPLAYTFATNTSMGGGYAAMDFVNGSIVLAPNTAVTLQELAATTQSSGIVSIVWAELPIS